MDAEISNKEEVFNYLGDGFINSNQRYRSLAMDVELGEMQEINGIQTQRFDGYFVRADEEDTRGRNYCAGYFFEFNDRYCMLLGLVTDEAQPKELIREVDIVVDCMMLTVRSEMDKEYILEFTPDYSEVETPRKGIQEMSDAELGVFNIEDIGDLNYDENKDFAPIHYEETNKSNFYIDNNNPRKWLVNDGIYNTIWYYDEEQVDEALIEATKWGLGGLRRKVSSDEIRINSFIIEEHSKGKIKNQDVYKFEGNISCTGKDGDYEGYLTGYTVTYSNTYEQIGRAHV